ncbi:MAG: ABC-2 transporter permease [Methanocalculaceae archaeon]|jgi:hypothetical protein|nr:ABC-2 transporter permease [Methanocalculaceae archaeon]
MNGLLYKDLLNLSSTTKYLVLVMLFFCVIFVPQGNELPVYILLIIFGAMLPMTVNTYDTTVRWDKYAASLPVTRKEIVWTRYQLMLIGMSVAGIISLIIATMMTVLLPGEGVFLSVLDPLTLTVMFLACGLLVGSVILPLTLKFGNEVTRYIIIMIALVPVVVILGLTFLLLPSGLTFPILPLSMIAGALTAVAVIGVVVSYRLSVRIYMKKEF